MGYDRIAVKQAAKASIRAASGPSARTMTAVYILLTTGVAFLQALFLPSPAYTVQELLDVGYDPTAALSMAFQGMGKAALFVTIVLSLYNMVMGFGYTACAMRIARNQHGGIANLFDGFSLAGKVIVLELLRALFVSLWSMLFVFPGIIAAYRYRLATYLLIDDPDLSPLEAIRRSKAYMAGYKMDLFVLDLSFFGWALLGGLVETTVACLLDHTFLAPGAASALGTLIVSLVFYTWLYPYMECSWANFYDCVTGGYEEPQGEKSSAPWEL